MKKILFALLLLTPLFTFAQAEKEVEAAVLKLTVAMLAGDVKTLKSLTSEKLTYGHSSGVIEDQAAFLAVFESNVSDIQKWEVSDQTISMHSKELAIVRHNVIADFASNGKVNTLKLGVMTVWVKEKGDWKLLARQGFRTPPAQ